MTPGAAHPHLEHPIEEQLLENVTNKAPEIQELYLAVHRLVTEALPDVRVSVDCTDGEIGYGAHQYGYDGWGMTAVAPYSRWVTLAFVRGAGLDDPEGLLEGAGTTVRSMKLASLEELDMRRDAIRCLLEAAREAKR